jgi:hypothetical protein
MEVAIDGAVLAIMLDAVLLSHAIWCGSVEWAAEINGFA